MSNLAIDNNNINRQQDKLWHWQAHLQLELTHGLRGTVLKRCRHKGPLYVQKPFYPEGKDTAHIYLLHPPGGLVSGDNLTIDIDVTDKASTVMTTPGAARLYRARESDSVQRQQINLHIKQDASLEWFPMETIVYNGAEAELTTTIDLAENSTYMGWEITCLGLPASDKPMESGYFQQRYKITRNGLPLFIDRLHFAPESPQLFTGKAGMQSRTSSGFFIAGEFTHTSEERDVLFEQIRDMLEQKNLSDLVAVTSLGSFIVSRYLGDSANQARDAFTLIWEILRPVLLNKKACHPRIWLT
jgi:urease accessory protein